MKNKQILDIMDHTFQSDYPHVPFKMRSCVPTKRIDHDGMLHPRSCIQIRVSVSLINRIPRVRYIRS